MKEGEWYTVREFAKRCPDVVRSFRQAERLASKRRQNGLEEMGACVKLPGLPIMFNRANFYKWLEKYAQSKRCSTSDKSIST